MNKQRHEVYIDLNSWRHENGEGPKFNGAYYDLSDKGQDWLQKAIIRNAIALGELEDPLESVEAFVGYKHRRKNTMDENQDREEYTDE